LRAPAAVIFLLASIAGATIANAQPALQCSGAQKPWAVADLLFGRTHVSEASWARFLATEVTPRFPDGFTVLASGASPEARKSPMSAASC
jgi:hypothetical protein